MSSRLFGSRRSTLRSAGLGGAGLAAGRLLVRGRSVAADLLRVSAERLFNASGRELAATSGRPWFTEASIVLLELASRWCWVCAAVIDTRRLRAESSAAVGRAFTPCGPPLKLTRFPLCSFTTFLD